MLVSRTCVSCTGDPVEDICSGTATLLVQRHLGLTKSGLRNASINSTYPVELANADSTSLISKLSAGWEKVQ